MICWRCQQPMSLAWDKYLGQNNWKCSNAMCESMEKSQAFWPKPRWEPIWLACRACHHEWDDWQPAMVPVETWVAHCGTFRCPKCSAGKGNILIRTTPLKVSDAA